MGLNLAKLQGASLDGASLDGAYLAHSNFQGASLVQAKLQGALPISTQFEGSSLEKAEVWRTRHFLRNRDHRALPYGYLAALDGLDFTQQPFEPEMFKSRRDKILAEFSDKRKREEVNDSLSQLDPESPEPEDAITEADWNAARKDNPTGKANQNQTAAFLSELACAGENAPFVARGLIKNKRFLAAGRQLAKVAERLKDPKQKRCAGAEGLTKADLAQLELLLAEEKSRRDND